MFERDKADLKQFGFEIETLVRPSSFGADDPASTRYRIGKDSNRLPEVVLTPAEGNSLAAGRPAMGARGARHSSCQRRP